MSLLSVMMLIAAAPKKKNKTSADARSERQKTEQQMKQTSKKITLTDTQIKQRLSRLNTLQQGVNKSEATAARLSRRLDSLNVAQKELKDSIAVNEARLTKLRELYTQAVRSSRRNRREMNPVTFIFSAGTFRQAVRRMRYLEEYSAWRGRKTDEINATVGELNAQKDSLAAMAAHIGSLRAQAIDENRRLKAGRDSVQSVVTSLQGEKKKLSALLTRQQQTIRKLDQEIDRLIAAEAEAARKAEEAAARKRAEEAKRQAEQAAQNAAKAAKTGKSDKSDKSDRSDKSDQTAPKPVKSEFAALKGQLPSPVSHTYVIARPFGVQAHKTHTHVEVNNPGIDIETAKGAVAKAVHPGVVSAVFVQDGYDHVVLIRHGSYLTVYANVKSISVAKGDKVTVGQTIGVLGPSETNDNRSMLHFEIRHERDKLNPALWLKK